MQNTKNSAEYHQKERHWLGSERVSWNLSRNVLWICDPN